MQLHYAKGTIAVAAAITLEESGLPHDLVRVDFSAAEQRGSGYLALNPKGRVPALVLADGSVLTETGAVLEYIAACAPDAGLVPGDAREAAHMRSVMYYLASTMHVNHAHIPRGSRWADRPESIADMKAKGPANMAENAAFIEAHGLRGDYVLGAAFSIADPYLFAVCRWLDGDGVPSADHPRIAAFLARMADRASVRAVAAKGVF